MQEFPDYDATGAEIAASYQKIDDAYRGDTYARAFFLHGYSEYATLWAARADAIYAELLQDNPGSVLRVESINSRQAVGRYALHWAIKQESSSERINEAEGLARKFSASAVETLQKLEDGEEPLVQKHKILSQASLVESLYYSPDAGRRLAKKAIASAVQVRLPQQAGDIHISRAEKWHAKGRALRHSFGALAVSMLVPSAESSKENPNSRNESAAAKSAPWRRRKALNIANRMIQLQKAS